MTFFSAEITVFCHKVMEFSSSLDFSAVLGPRPDVFFFFASRADSLSRQCSAVAVCRCRAVAMPLPLPCHWHTVAVPLLPCRFHAIAMPLPCQRNLAERMRNRAMRHVHAGTCLSSLGVGRDPPPHTPPPRSAPRHASASEFEPELEGQ